MVELSHRETSPFQDPSSTTTVVARHKLTDLSLGTDGGLRDVVHCILEENEGTTERSGSQSSLSSSSVSSDKVEGGESSACDQENGGDGGSSDTGIRQIRGVLTRIEALLEQRRNEEAVEIMEKILVGAHKDPDALCVHARCLAASGRLAQALASYAAALAIDSRHVKSLLGCAFLYQQSGELTRALNYLNIAYEKVNKEGLNSSAGVRSVANDALLNRAESFSSFDSAELKCQNAENKNTAESLDSLMRLREQIAQALATVLTDLGTQEKISGGKDWHEYYFQAAKIWPKYAQAHYNLGVAASESGNLEDAVAYYQKAVELENGYAEAWCNLGVLWRSQGRLRDAVSALERAYKIAPTNNIIIENLAVALTQMGVEHKSQGNSDDAISCYDRAVAVHPNYGEALYNLGVAHAEMKQYDKAEFMYRLAISACGSAEAYNNLGVLYRERGNHEAALKCYEQALERRPSFPQALNNLAVMYTQQGRAAEAFNLLQACLLADPSYAEGFNNLGVLQRDIGEAHAAISSYESCTKLDRNNRNSGQNRLLALNYVYCGETEIVCKAHVEWGQNFEALHRPLSELSLNDIDLTERRPLVVGYLTPDLFTHSVSYFAEAPVTLHNASRVKTIVYSVCLCPDEKTERIKRKVEANGGVWREVSQKTEQELAYMIREDKVDILVELTGHTAHNRLQTLAYRPAPVQVTWIGYPNSTGMSRIDYRFTDNICDPESTKQTFTERLVRLPGCFLCYTPTWDAPNVSPPPAISNGYITFGSFNALAKQTPEVLRVWCNILKSMPSSRLVLKNKPFACPTTRQKYWEFFEAEGVSRDRIDLLPLARATKHHLNQYAMIDIALDPWPYAGTTTTVEALFMGVPCLTLSGQCHAQNVGASLLTAVGLGEEWIAKSTEEYIEKAMKLSDITVLSNVRKQLRDKMLSSRLCDGPKFVAELENVYHSLWKAWIEDQQKLEKRDIQDVHSSNKED